MTAPSKQWYIQVGQATQGPFNTDQLRHLANSTQITSQTMVMLDGNNQWVRAEQIRGLFPAPVPTVINVQPQPPVEQPRQEIFSYDRPANLNFDYLPERQRRSGRQSLRTHNIEIQRSSSPLGIASLVIGIIACLFAWIPYLGMIALPMGVIGIVLAVIGILISLFSPKTSSSYSIGGLITCIVALVVAYNVTATVNDALLATSNKKGNESTIDEQTLDEGSSEAPASTAQSPFGNKKEPASAAAPSSAAAPYSAPAKTVFEPIQFNHKYSLNNIQFTFDRYEWVTKIEPSNKSGYYSYFSAQPDEKYLVIYGSIKNKAGESKSICDIPSEFVLNQKYEYSGTIQLEDSDGQGFHHVYSTKPLKTEKVLFYASVPNEIAENFSGGKFTFGFNEDLEFGYFTSLEKCEHRYELDIPKNQ